MPRAYAPRIATLSPSHRSRRRRSRRNGRRHPEAADSRAAARTARANGRQVAAADGPPAHRAEDAASVAERARPVFAVVEERVADAPAAPGRQQHRFGKVEGIAHVLTCRVERCSDVRVLVGERQGRGRTDERSAGEGTDHEGARRGGEAAEIPALVVERAGVEIRPVAKDRDPQPRQIVQRLGDGVSLQAADLDVVHAPRLAQPWPTFKSCAHRRGRRQGASFCYARRRQRERHHEATFRPLGRAARA